MAATCKTCHTSVSTYRDVLELANADLRAVWASIIESLPYIGDVFCGGGVPALCAAPLNRLGAPCPNCAAREWEATRVRS